MTALLVMVGGALGAPLRHLVDVLARDRLGSALPWGTWLVNVAGSFVLGVVASLVVATEAPAWLLTMIGVGFCGALTTFSTFSLQVVRLLEEQRMSLAAGYALGSLASGFAAFSLGWMIASWL